MSKWESGNGVPDIYIFLRLAELYGVTVNDLVGEEPSAPKKGKAPKGRNIFVALLSSGLVWLVATAVFVLLKLFLPGGPWWAAFLYAVPANAIVITVLASVWKYRMVNFISVTRAHLVGARLRICDVRPHHRPGRRPGGQSLADLSSGRASAGSGSTLVLFPLDAVSRQERSKRRPKGGRKGQTAGRRENGRGRGVIIGKGKANAVLSL